MMVHRRKLAQQLSRDKSNSPFLFSPQIKQSSVAPMHVQICKYQWNNQGADLRKQDKGSMGATVTPGAGVGGGWRTRKAPLCL